MTPHPHQTYTANQVARMIGHSRKFVERAIEAGRLRSRRLVAGGGVCPQNARHIIAREDLVRWLVSGPFDRGILRKIMNSGYPDAALVCTPPSLQAAVLRFCPAVQVGSLFSLGKTMGERKLWAAVVDLSAVGAAEATRSLAALSREADRPELVGLYDDEVAPRPETAEVFDLLVPLSRSPAAIARTLKDLRP
jgi:hypothetical protein